MLRVLESPVPTCCALCVAAASRVRRGLGFPGMWVDWIGLDSVAREHAGRCAEQRGRLMWHPQAQRVSMAGRIAQPLV